MDQRKKNLTFRGYLEEDIAYRFGEDPDFAKLRTTLWGELRGNITRNLQFTLSGRGWYDPIYNIRDFSKDVKDAYMSEAAIREAYVDIFLKNLKLRLGMQLVSWGKGDYFRLIDVLNPLDMREFALWYLHDYSEGRLPLLMGRLIILGEETSLELLWIPLFESTRTAPSDSSFAVKQIFPQGFNLRMNDAEKPSKSIENSELGARLTTNIKGIDLEFYAYKGWNDDPSLYKEINLSTSELIITPRHRPLQFIGAGVALPVEFFVFKGDIAYFIDRPLEARLPESGDGIIERNQLGWICGIEYTYKDFFLGLQGLYFLVIGNEEFINMGRWDQNYSIIMQQGILNKRIILRLMGIYRVDEKDGLLIPEVKYEISDRMNIAFGVDLFVGPKDSLYGQFSDQDQLFLKFRYYF